nr:MAG TPA: hypothetical protein [Caudoviricetes sp.]
MAVSDLISLAVKSFIASSSIDTPLSFSIPISVKELDLYCHFCNSISLCGKSKITNPATNHRKKY